MKTTLWLVPAATADPQEPRGLDRHSRATMDAARALFKQQGVRFERLLHAPSLGASGSAQRLVERVGGGTACEPRLVVGPLDSMLSDHYGVTQLAIVADATQLARLAALLVLGCQSEADRFELSAGSPICCVGELRPGAMRLAGLRPGADRARGS